jgi:NAD(P)-dependent dehydrogenase (short-subunit alcohol dehydrogenase family)
VSGDAVSDGAVSDRPGEGGAGPLDLSGRTVLISGGAGALGRAIVGRLVGAGAHVVVGDLVPDAEAARVLPHDDRIAYVRADTADEAAVERLLDSCVERLGHLPDSVCCHAGVVEAHPVQEFPVEAFDRIMNVNVRAAFLLARATSRRWTEAGVAGHLVFTTSWVQDVPWPEITPYNASKAAVRSLARGFARELAPHGIRANAVAPGIVAAGMAQRQWDMDPDYRARARRAIPLGRLQPPESVADAFLFLLSPLASYMTGSVLLVDGGCSLYPMDEDTT